MLGLDYDNVQLPFIVHELFHLKQKFGHTFELWESGQRGFHIKSAGLLPKEEAFTIMEHSKCSEGYKIYARKVDCFPMRESKKEVWKNGKLKETVPKPQFIMRI